MKRPRSAKTIWIRRLTVAVFMLNLLAVTWPVIQFFRQADPRFLGLPLSMAWPVGWIVVGWIMLLLLDYFERREEDG
ncbi:MAG: hypothetical protein AAGB27_02465 [Pseudomonadota bacterium]